MSEVVLIITSMLAVIDAAALSVGLLVLKRVTKIVHETADAVQEATNESIAKAESDAVDAFMRAATPVFDSFKPLIQQELAEAAAKLIPLLSSALGNKLERDADVHTGTIHSLKSGDNSKSAVGE